VRLRTLFVDIPAKIVDIAWKTYLVVVWVVVILACVTAALSAILGFGFGLPPI
jgi:hypothetical protein